MDELARTDVGLGLTGVLPNRNLDRYVFLAGIVRRIVTLAAFLDKFLESARCRSDVLCHVLLPYRQEHVGRLVGRDRPRLLQLDPILVILSEANHIRDV